MPDGKKSGKVKKFLRIFGSVIDVAKMVPGPHMSFMPWVEKAIDGAETLNGPGGGGKKKQLVIDTMNDVFAAMESRGVFTVPADLREALPDLVDSIVSVKNEVGGFEAIGNTIDLRPGVGTPVTFRGIIEPKGPGE